jgi:uncharacterized protein (TIGR00296 family)
MAYSVDDGSMLVKAARNTIELYLKSPKFSRYMIEKYLKGFESSSGVFVTLEHHPTMTLRGCIGFPNPVGPLKKLLIEAAIGAAFEDPRFAPLSEQELGETVVEVSVLTKPELIDQSSASGRMKEIKVGRDGLMIKYGYKTGLLLPIVAVQELWNKEEFLKNLCLKAGLAEDAWKRPEIDLYKFSTQVFKEKEPAGAVEEVHLD